MLPARGPVGWFGGEQEAIVIDGARADQLDPAWDVIEELPGGWDEP